ncbi:MAG: hypothetical protein IEMM0008_0944 [bacterium]|nr:MAG: hypothetical protein IEMM0008_0944 [bacterium]
MDMNERLKLDILSLFRRNQLKQSQAIDPRILSQFLSSLKENRDKIHDVIDDMIMKGLLLETRSMGKSTFLLTKHGEELAYR